MVEYLAIASWLAVAYICRKAGMQYGAIVLTLTFLYFSKQLLGFFVHQMSRLLNTAYLSRAAWLAIAYLFRWSGMDYGALAILMGLLYICKKALGFCIRQMGPLNFTIGVVIIFITYLFLPSSSGAESRRRGSNAGTNIDEVEEDDYYAILQVSETASGDDIRASFRRLSLVHHPDKNLDDQEGATRRFTKLKIAYEVFANSNYPKNKLLTALLSLNRHYLMLMCVLPFFSRLPF